MEFKGSGTDTEEPSQMGKHFVFRGLGGHERGYGVEAEREWRGVSAALAGS